MISGGFNRLWNVFSYDMYVEESGDLRENLLFGSRALSGNAARTGSGINKLSVVLNCIIVLNVLARLTRQTLES